MSLSGIKIITPNKYFDAHINDLSVELGLTAIDRFSVEEYYVFLIKKYYSKANVTADVCSEKSLNPKLLEDIYSLQYLDNSIAHYHEYWEQILTALNQPKLQEYFARFTLIYPNTALHTAATVVQMEQSLQQILITISAAEKKKESVAQRIEATSKEIEVGIIDPTTFTTFGDMWIFCRDSCDVWSCKRENFRPVFERICQTDYQITALAVNERYHSIVFATVDGKVHFHTINGHEINTVEINEVAVKLLITDVWGFVVIVSDLKLFVYNVNGTFVKSHELQHPIVCWSPFSSHDGFDFIVFSDTSGHVGFFEVFYPSEIIALLELRDTMTVNFDSESQSFVAVSGDGHDHVY